MEQNIEEAKREFEEFFEKAEAFMKKYGQPNGALIITNDEIKIVDCRMFRKFKKGE